MQTKTLNGVNLSGDSSSQVRLRVDDSINCPFCHRGIETQPIFYLKIDDENIQVFLKCRVCSSSFVGYCNRSSQDTYQIIGLSKGNKAVREFDEIVNVISSSFIRIYGEAEIAQNEGLTEICGIGYRKALEFLIKDYIISQNSEEEHENIKSMFLSNCIDKYINNDKIKEITKRAIWLGNDETHYVRKWEEKDLKDLLKLIDITLNYIIMEFESNKYIEEMS